VRAAPPRTASCCTLRRPSQALKERRTRFSFLRREIRLVPTCGVFVTTSAAAGLEGSDFPDILRVLLRPVRLALAGRLILAGRRGHPRRHDHVWGRCRLWRQTAA
jgi:hypothetical protein